MPYEKLLQEAYQQEIDIYEEPLKNRIKGLYSDNVIWINKNIDTSTEKACVLAEELGHYHTSSGDILDQADLQKRKQEKKARKWAWNRLITPNKLIEAYREGCCSKHEIAEALGITESFLDDGLNFYRERYGTELQVDEKHVLYLDPLTLFEIV